MNEKMRRIIYVWNYREWGGAQIYFLSLMKEAKKSYAVSALIPANSEPKIMQYLSAMGVPYDFLLPAPSGVNPLTITAKISRRWTLLKSENALVRRLAVDNDLTGAIIHADLGFWQSFLPLFRLSLKTHVFMTVHTALPLMHGVRAFLWKLKGNILSQIRTFHLIASNNDAKAGLRPYVSPERLEQIQVSYSGFEPEEISEVIENHHGKQAVLTSYGLPGELPILVTVGQFIPRKGCWILLDSLGRLKSEGREFVFLWLATSAPDEAAMSRIEGYGLHESFRLMAAQEIGETREQLLTLLSVADLFVLASLQEGLPIALVEAMALGLACITTNVNAIPEAVKDRENGRLVDPDDADSLADVIGELLNDRAQREALGAAAKKFAFENFDAKITAERTVKLYDEVWKSGV